MSVYTVIDMLHRKIVLHSVPKKIVSLVPSQTELLYDLGLDKEVIGITKFCVHPEKWFRSKERVGGTKKLNIEKIIALKPDLIIANKEENEKQQIDFLAEKFPVWVSDIHDMETALQMISDVGEIAGKKTAANELTQKIKTCFDKLERTISPKRVLYFIWREPWISIGGDTFISSMIEKTGWNNILQHKTRYPELPIDELKMLAPQIILLSSEPYPFKEKHIAEVQTLFPRSKIVLVDGEMFSWYGSRMLKAADYFEELLKSV